MKESKSVNRHKAGPGGKDGESMKAEYKIPKGWVRVRKGSIIRVPEDRYLDRDAMEWKPAILSVACSGDARYPIIRKAKARSK